MKKIFTLSLLSISLLAALPVSAATSTTTIPATQEEKQTINESFSLGEATATPAFRAFSSTVVDYFNWTNLGIDAIRTVDDFTITGSNVIVDSIATDSITSACAPYSIQLNKKTWLGSESKGKITYLTNAGVQTGTWNSVGSGDYYLLIWNGSNTNRSSGSGTVYND
jgi:hypothetical protein